MSRAKKTSPKTFTTLYSGTCRSITCMWFRAQLWNGHRPYCSSL